MATVLEKPILLDETGQDIVSKLDEIKAAITTSGDFTPIMIKVTTPPTKTTYLSGELLDLSGMVVTLIGNNGVNFDVTAACTFSIAEGTPIVADTNITISFEWQRDDITFTAIQKVNLAILSSISITIPPDITEFYVGEELDLTGIVITANYNGGVTQEVTANCTFNPADGDVLTVNDTQITVSYTEGSITKTAIQEIELIPVYGAEWDGTATTAWTRTDAAQNFTDPIPAVNSGDGSSPFDDIMPWSGMVVSANPGDTDVGHVVAIPKFYYKWTKEGSKMKLQISATKLRGFLTSPAHADRGDGKGERDVVYIGKYLCADSRYWSTDRYEPQVDKTIAEFRTNIHSLGETIWQQDYAMYWTIRMLYLVEYADWNVKAKLGIPQQYDYNGDSDGIIYHTGTTAVDRNTAGYIKYRNIENFGGYYAEFYDGVYVELIDWDTRQFGLYCIKNPALFSNDSNGTFVSNVTAIQSYMKSWGIPSTAGFEYALFPNSGGGSASTYVCANAAVYSASKILSTIIGMPFSFDMDSATATGNLVSSRLMILP